MVNPLHTADRTLTAWAAFSGLENIENKRPSNWNVGAPGGWPTCSLNAVAMYSPQSHHDAVASAVMMYTVHAIAQIIHPITLFAM